MYAPIISIASNGQRIDINIINHFRNVFFPEHEEVIQALWDGNSAVHISVFSASLKVMPGSLCGFINYKNITARVIHDLFDVTKKQPAGFFISEAANKH